MIKRGDEFLHRSYTDPDAGNRPLRCRVTRFQSGTVYYRTVYADGRLGACYHFDQTDAARYIGERL